VLAGINLEIQPGELLAIVGPNGAGKTTLLRILTGLMSPSSGEVSLAGESIQSMEAPRRARQLAYAPQRSIVPVGFTVEQVVGFGRFSSEVSRSASGLALDTLELRPHAQQPVQSLSAGQWQRVVLARAIAQLQGHTGPVFLLADEPTSALDPRHALLVMDRLCMLTHTSRPDAMGVVVVLHDLSLAARYADRVLLLRPLEHEPDPSNPSPRSVHALGSPGEVLIPAVIGPLFGVGFVRQPSPAGPLIAPISHGGGSPQTHVP
jgi:iron complex transport system ATP-binding protein